MKIVNVITHGIGVSFSLVYALAMGLACLGCLVIGGMATLAVIHGILRGDWCRELALATLMALVCLGGGLAVCFFIWRNAVPRRPKDAELQVPAERSCALNYATLEERLALMAPFGDEDEVEIDKEARFLSWSDRVFCDLVIQGLGGDDWLAFFWPFVEKNICLSHRQLADLFQREHVQLPERCRPFQPGAVAFCRGGQLRVYPASALEFPGENYPPMQDEESFRRWMEEVTRHGVLDV